MPKFGIKVYDELKYMLEYACEYRIDINVPDIYCLYDHKKFMADRVRYLNGAEHLSCSPELQEKFDRIEHSGRILMMLAVKLNQTEFQKQEDRRAFIKRVDILRDLEEEAYTKYYEYNRLAFESTL